MRRRILWLTFWVTMAFWFGFGLAGCGSLNESTRLGSTPPLPALANGRPIEFATTKSVSGADRSSWEPITIRVSADDVRSWPTYGRYSLLQAEDRGPRVRGIWPTLGSSIQPEQGELNRILLYLEVPAESAHQLANMVLIPGYFLTRTWSGVQLMGPRESYQRGVAAAPARNEMHEEAEAEMIDDDTAE